MPRLGVLSNLFLNSAGWDAPTWNALNIISDCNVDGSWEEGEASARTSRVNADEPTMMGIEITGKVRVADSLVNIAYGLMYNAYFRDLQLDVLVLNGGLIETGASGYRFRGKVFNWSEDQSLGVVLFKDFSIKPCIPLDYSQSGITIFRAPKIANVVAGTLVYSDIGMG